jgi:hypothetical protein
MLEALDQFMTVAGRLTVGALLLLAVVALLREMIVPGPTHQRELADRDRQLANLARERDEWKRLALSSTRLAAEAARAVDPSTPVPPIGADRPSDRTVGEQQTGAAAVPREKA